MAVLKIVEPETLEKNFIKMLLKNETVVDEATRLLVELPASDREALIVRLGLNLGVPGSFFRQKIKTFGKK